MISLPTVQGDVWRLATQEEKTFWLGLLSTLRDSSGAGAEAQAFAYGIVLDEAPFYGMSEAIKLILKGRAGLNPAFAPQPSELGAVIDRIMQPHVDARAREAQQRRRLEWDEDKRGGDTKALADARTPEARARVGKLLADAGLPPTRREIAEQRMIAERATVRATYGITSARLAAIPDRPDAMQRPPSPLLLAPPVDASAMLEPPDPPSDHERRAGLEIVGGEVKITDALRRALAKQGLTIPPTAAGTARSRRRAVATAREARRG